MFRKIIFSAVIALILVTAALFVANSTSASSTPGSSHPSAARLQPMVSPTPMVIASQEEMDYPITYNSWHGTATTNTTGFRYVHVANEVARFSFTGTSVTWVTRKGTDEGKAQVLIDNAPYKVYDLYAVTFQEQYHIVISGLTNAKHTIVVQALGTKNPNSQDTRVAVDAFIAGGVTTQDNTSKIKFDTWQGYKNVNATGGQYRVSGTAGAYVYTSFTQNAARIGFYTAMGPSYGKAKITVDGHSQGIIDLYAPTQKWAVPFDFPTYTVLFGQQHSIRIDVLGQKNAASNHPWVVIDAFYMAVH